MKYFYKGKGPKQQANPLKKIIHNGIPFCSIADAAKYLGTTPPKVRQMMGNGSLEWAQFKENGKLFVTTQSLSAKKQSTRTR